MTTIKDLSSLKQQHLENVTAKAREIMERDGIEALVATVGDNFYHLTGFASFFHVYLQADWYGNRGYFS
ncbi:Xaa-Pro aminopeptidase [Providencia alcalifaciens]|nr:Xaa-Pro aminopeptidase [Providencia alcalifaciens]